MGKDFLNKTLKVRPKYGRLKYLVQKLIFMVLVTLTPEGDSCRHPHRAVGNHWDPPWTHQLLMGILELLLFSGGDFVCLSVFASKLIPPAFPDGHTLYNVSTRKNNIATVRNTQSLFVSL